MPFRFFPLIKNTKISDDVLALRMSNVTPVPKRGDTTYKVTNQNDLYRVNFHYTAIGNGTLILEEDYLIKDWNEDEPYTLFGFSYTIRITGRYRLFVHYHPDSDNVLHSLVHMEFKNEQDRRARKIYLNPFLQINIPQIAQANGEELNVMWNFNHDWLNFFHDMFNIHAKDKEVTVEDCYSSILSKL